MTDKIKKIIELHLNYEIDLISSEKIKSTTKNEIILFLEWAHNKKFSLLFPKDKTEARLKDIIQNFSIKPEILELLRKSISANYRILEKENIKLNDLLDKEEFLKSARDTIGMKNAREKIIKFVVNSSAYSRMMSSIIYASIKDFLSQNPLTKNNPMASSFMKMGQDLLNNLPGMQGNFDATIMDFLRNSLGGRIQESEKLIKEELDAGKNTDELFLEIWEFLGTISISDIKNLVPEIEMQKLLERLPGFWEHVKASGVAEKISKHQIDEFYIYFGEKTIGEILKEIGLTQEDIASGLSENLYLYLENSEFKQYYKSRIEDRLKNFYSTDEVVKLLG